MKLTGSVNARFPPQDLFTYPSCPQALKSTAKKRKRIVCIKTTTKNNSNINNFMFFYLVSFSFMFFGLAFAFPKDTHAHTSYESCIPLSIIT